MLEYLQRLAWDPTAPVPAGWPHGWYGVLLLFCVPGGAGIPPGVLLGDADGLGPLAMTALYFASDVVLAALLFEPVLRLLALASARLPVFERAGRVLMLAVARTMPAGSLAGPTGVMLTAFGAGLPFGRVLAGAAGYGLLRGWALSIAGDMCYFALGMASTLWFRGVLGDPRLAALGALIVMLVVPVVVRYVRRSG